MEAFIEFYKTISKEKVQQGQGGVHHVDGQVVHTKKTTNFLKIHFYPKT